MAEITHRFVNTNGIRMHIAEAGQGPLVVLCHGFPESWYSWRHQLRALAEAGYHAVAPDQRGYGQTDKPAESDKYTQLHLVGDIVGLLDALGEETAVVAGHDWGAPVAWNCALLRPDRFPAVIGLSVPYSPRAPFPPIAGMKAMAGENFFYILYFQEPGVAEAELERDVRSTMRQFLYSASGDTKPGEQWRAALPKTATFLDATVDPPQMPGWVSDADLDFFVAEFERTGFRGGLNWYRNMDRTWELMAAYDALPKNVPHLRQSILLPGCGHWTQQERPDEVNTAMVEFLKGR